MASSSLPAIAAVLLVASSPAFADSQLSASLGYVADDNDSSSFDADVAFAPVEPLELALGGGSTDSPSTVGRIEGKSLRAAADVHSERFGLRSYYRQWHSRMLDTDTLGARASVAAGAFTLSITGEKRDFDVDYMTGPTATQPSTEHFNGTGWGAGLKYSRSGWTGYADAMFFHYGSLSRYVQTYSPSVIPPPDPGAPSGPPPSLLDTVAALPVASGALGPILPVASQSVLTVAPVLSTSVVTVGEGALDHLYTAGIERAFTRVSLRLEWTGARDAILSSTTNSYRAGIGFVISRHVNVDVSAGITDSYVGSASFGGLSVGVVF